MILENILLQTGCVMLHSKLKHTMKFMNTCYGTLVAEHVYKYLFSFTSKVQLGIMPTYLIACFINKALLGKRVYLVYLIACFIRP